MATLRRLKLLKIAAWLLFISASLVLGLWAYQNILFPSYASVAGSCLPDEFERLEKKGVRTAGQITANETGAEIEIFISKKYPSARKRVLKHELVHLKQWEQGRLWGC